MTVAQLSAHKGTELRFGPVAPLPYRQWTLTFPKRVRWLGRERLYKALSPGAKPRFDTVLRVARALGVRLTAHVP